MLPDMCPWKENEAIFKSLHDSGKLLTLPEHLMEVINFDGLSLTEISVISFRLGLFGNIWHNIDETVDFFGHSITAQQLDEIERKALCKYTDEKTRLFRALYVYYEQDRLSPREEKLLLLHWGIEDGRTRTREETAQIFGCTPERVRLAESKVTRRGSAHRRRKRRYADYYSD